MSIWQNIYGILFRPNVTFKYLGVNYSSNLLLQGLTILILTCIIRETPSIQTAISTLLTWLFFSSMIFLIAFIFKLQSQDYPKLIALLAFANLPLIFLAPIDIILEFNKALGAFLRLIVFIWVFYLNLVAISYACDISKTKALLIYLLVPLTISFFIFNFIVGSIASLL